MNTSKQLKDLNKNNLILALKNAMNPKSWTK